MAVNTRHFATSFGRSHISGARADRKDWQSRRVNLHRELHLAERAPPLLRPSTQRRQSVP